MGLITPTNLQAFILNLTNIPNFERTLGRLVSVGIIGRSWSDLLKTLLEVENRT